MFAASQISFLPQKPSQNSILDTQNNFFNLSKPTLPSLEKGGLECFLITPFFKGGLRGICIRFYHYAIAINSPYTNPKLLTISLKPTQPPLNKVCNLYSYSKEEPQIERSGGADELKVQIEELFQVESEVQDFAEISDELPVPNI